jgi:hypothetical protein
MKLLQENLREMHQHIGMGMVRPQMHRKQSKNRKWNYIKLKICTGKETRSRIKIQNKRKYLQTIHLTMS